MKNEFNVTYDIYRKWCIESSFRGQRLVFMVFWVIMAIATLLFCIFVEWSVLYFLLFVFCIYRAFFRVLTLSKYQYNRFSQVLEGKDWVRSIVFGDKEIVVAEGQVETSYKYEDIKEVKVKDRDIQLVFNNKVILRMFKDTFVEGDWESCKELLKKKNVEIKL